MSIYNYLFPYCSKSRAADLSTGQAKLLPRIQLHCAARWFDRTLPPEADQSCSVVLQILIGQQERRTAVDNVPSRMAAHKREDIFGSDNARRMPMRISMATVEYFTVALSCARTRKKNNKR